MADKPNRIICLKDRILMYINGLEVFRIFNGKLTLGVILDKPYVKVSHVEAYNVGGGDSAGGTWKARIINTEDSDDSNICSIASNQITLDAGTYVCSISCPSYAAGRNQAMLYNVTDGVVTLLGTSEHIDTTLALVTRTFIKGKFKIASQKTFEIRHRCASTVSSGFGIPHNFAGYDNVYTIAEFWGR